MSNPIPELARVLVRGRDRDQCVRCRMPGSAWHHRRGRSVPDGHQHCACNGIILCDTCHRWVHANPLVARLKGWIVSRHADQPGDVPVEHALYGWVTLECDGGTSAATDPTEEEEG